MTTNPNQLNDLQRDGQACVECGLDYNRHPHVPNRPVGYLNGGQIFACNRCTASAAPGLVAVVVDDPDAPTDEPALSLRTIFQIAFVAGFRFARVSDYPSDVIERAWAEQLDPGEQAEMAETLRAILRRRALSRAAPKGV
jgi:hypothetical protein